MSKTTIDAWNVKNYSQFLDLRTRPARDLLAAIPDTFHPKTVYDLGCGPGNSTILLKERWPEATVIGLDVSQNMLDDAIKQYPDIQFMLGDIADFSLDEQVDCIFANASLQWVDHHEVFIPKLLNQVAKGGVLAIQMPNNFHSPSHQVTIDILESKPAWKNLLSELCYGKLSEPLYNSSWYYDLINTHHVTDIQIWETTYFQEMQSATHIFDWVKGTGLRPVLAKMTDADQTEFAKIYVEKIAKYYNKLANNKIMFPFRRFFILAVK
jgi:trans-aconitate 2-methyltransferase